MLLKSEAIEMDEETDVGHDGGISYAEVADCVDAQLRVHDGTGVAAVPHFASARLMVQRRRIVTKETAPVIVGPQFDVLAARERLVVEARTEALERLSFTEG